MAKRILFQPLVFLGLAFCTVGLSTAHGQYIYSEIESASGTVWSYSGTLAFYDEYSDGAIAEAYLYGPTSYLDSGYDEVDPCDDQASGYVYAEVYLEGAATQSGYYYVEGQHWYYYLGVEDWEYLGESYDGTTVSSGVGPPTIAALSPSSGTYGEGDGWGAGYGYIQIYGSNFDPQGCGCVSSAIPFPVQPYSVSDGQVNLYYPDNQSVGHYAVSIVTTLGATSNSMTFTISGDPTPSVTSINPPSPWQSGTSFELTVNGLGFGTSPTLSVSDPAGQISFTQDQNCLSDSCASGLVTIGSGAPTETATISINSNGYYGNGFQGGGQGGNQFQQQVQIMGPFLPTLTCPSSVTRFGYVTCNVTGAAASGVSWQFQGPANSVVAGPTGRLEWQGYMVVSGTVIATVAGYSGGPLQAPITVTPRNWALAAAIPAPIANGAPFANGTPVLLPSPPVANGEIGHSNPYIVVPYTLSSVASGPNGGFLYVSTSAPATQFQYELSPDLATLMSGSFTANTTSTFYTSQCGNYNATTNTGYISGGKLYANDVRHESSLTESSHWVLYSNSLAANNPGSGIEGQTAVPGTQMAAFNAQVNLATQTLLNQIYSDTGGNENTVPANSQNSIPYGVSYDANDVFQGNINTGPPYATCTQR